MIRLPSSSSISMLYHQPFRRYIVGYLLVTLGQQMQSVVIGWEIYDRTGSEWALGLVNLMQVLPVVALALFTGHILDHFSRKRILLLSQAGYGVMSVGLGLISLFHLPVKFMYACLLLGGTARAFFGPARASLLPQLLPPGQVAKALNFSSGVWQLAMVLGPALGGLLLATLQRPWCTYFFSSVSALGFVFLFWKISTKPQENQNRKITVENLLVGIRYILRTKLLLSVMVLDLFAVLLGGATTLLPVYAKEILHVGPSGLGWLRAAPAMGAVLTATVVAHWPPFQKAGRTLLIAVAGFGLCTIIFGLSRSFGLSLLMLVLLGGCDNISVVIRSTLEQLKTPDEMRGRVAAMSRLFIDLSNELGGFESGAVAHLVGPLACVVGGGLGTLGVVFCVAWVVPQLRKLGPLEET